MNTQEAIEALSNFQTNALRFMPDLVASPVNEALTHAIEHMKRFQWQPIESAPKDKYIILTNGDKVGQGVWHDGGGRHCFSKYTGSHHFGSHLPYCDYWSKDGANPFGVPYFGNGQPTHWMPLPDAPEVKE